MSQITPSRQNTPSKRSKPAPGRRHGGARRGAAPRTRVRPEARSSWLDRALAEAAQRPEPEARPFAEFGLPESLIAALSKNGMDTSFAIQTHVLPDALAGRHVLGRAHTGSGKTLAFGLPVLARLAATGSPRRPGAPRAMIVVPTRELASQVAAVLSPLAEALDQRVTTVVGGLPMGRQISALRRGVDVVVATPGRLIDLIERDACTLSSVEISVLDEADHLADLGFLPAVRRLLDATPSSAQRLLLSATLDKGVDLLVRDYMTEPAVHAVAPPADLHQAMDHQVFVLPTDGRFGIAAEIAARPGRTLFFVRTKHGADRLAKQLSRAGVPAAAIHGNRNQNQRQRALDAFATGSPRVLVATDVAARGIHVDDVDLVVHYDLPNDHKDYLHRSGRTARAGATGTVIAFVAPQQKRDIEALHHAAAVKATTTEVHPGHPAVLTMASSGEPIAIPVQRYSESARRERPQSRGRRRPSRAPHRSSSRS